jgi:LemA protein
LATSDQKACPAGFFVLYSRKMFETATSLLFDFISLPTLVIGVIAVGSFIWLATCYNQLSRLRAEIDEAFEKINVHIKERHHLVPTFIEIIKKHTKNTQPAATLIDNAAKARHTMAMAAERVRTFSNDASSINSLVNADFAFNLAIDHLTALQSSHETLRTDDVFKKLIKELGTIESNLSFTRQLYNDVVDSYNNTCASFPSVVLAAALGFRAAGTLATTKLRKETPSAFSRA